MKRFFLLALCIVSFCKPMFEVGVSSHEEKINTVTQRDAIKYYLQDSVVLDLPKGQYVNPVLDERDKCVLTFQKSCAVRYRYSDNGLQVYAINQIPLSPPSFIGINGTSHYTFVQKKYGVDITDGASWARFHGVTTNGRGIYVLDSTSCTTNRWGCDGVNYRCITPLSEHEFVTATDDGLQKWDMQKQYCIANYYNGKNTQGITALHAYKDLLFVASDKGLVTEYDMKPRSYESCNKRPFELKAVIDFNNVGCNSEPILDVKAYACCGRDVCVVTTDHRLAIVDLESHSLLDSKQFNQVNQKSGTLLPSSDGTILFLAQKKALSMYLLRDLCVKKYDESLKGSESKKKEKECFCCFKHANLQPILCGRCAKNGELVCIACIENGVYDRGCPFCRKPLIDCVF